MWEKIKKILRYAFIFGMLFMIAGLFVWAFWLSHRIVNGKEACFKACPNAKYVRVGNMRFSENFKYISKTDGIIKCMCFPNYKIIKVKEKNGQ